MVPVTGGACQNEGEDLSRRTHLRTRIDDRGVLEVVDPGWDCIDLMRLCDPDFEPRWAPLTGFTMPRFLRLQQLSCGYAQSAIEELPTSRLWNINNLNKETVFDKAAKLAEPNDASILDLKIELARRILMRCTFCAHRCGVNRTAGEKGICRLGSEALVAEHFVHIGEEPIVNPSLLVSLAGCGLRCKYCQQSAILDPSGTDGEVLEPSLWSALDKSGARSMSFAGGNPDESMYAILRFLNAAPSNWELPIVWNCHGATTPETLALLDGVVDVWIPDFKYGNNLCARKLSRIDGYWDVVRDAVEKMLDQEAPVIVRILVLPGHSECCHMPVLQELSRHAHRENLQVSIRGQYCPDWKIGPRDGELIHRSGYQEIVALIHQAQSLRLKLVD